MANLRPGTDASAGQREGTVVLEAYLSEVCDRIELSNGQLHAFLPEDARLERVLGAVSTGAGSTGALAGIAVGVKDIINVDGWETRAGSQLPPELFAGPQAAVVTRLADAGATVVGKTVTAEFAVSAPGPTVNPRNVRHTPGGSSSGSAAAVAAGLVPLALGTQTVGSVIRPAAYCGVVGWRPTWGRVPTDGVIANAPSLDVVGCFAADVAGVTAAATVICDGWQSPPDPERHPVLGVPTGPLLEQVSAPAMRIFSQETARLAQAGVEVRYVPLFQDWDEVVAQLLILNRYELAQVHAPWLERYRGQYRSETVAAVERGRMISTSEYAAALAFREDFRARLAQQRSDSGVDLWLTPAATGPAPLGLGSTGDPAMCIPFSLAGLPALTLPSADDPSGLPLGLQLVGGWGHDENLLRWAAHIEATRTAAA